MAAATKASARRRSRFRRRKQRCGTKRNFHTEMRRNEIQTYHRIATPVRCSVVAYYYRNIVRACVCVCVRSVCARTEPVDGTHPRTGGGGWWGRGVGRRRAGGSFMLPRPAGGGGRHRKIEMGKITRAPTTNATKFFPFFFFFLQFFSAVPTLKVCTVISDGRQQWRAATAGDDDVRSTSTCARPPCSLHEITRVIIVYTRCLSSCRTNLYR